MLKDVTSQMPKYMSEVTTEDKTKELCTARGRYVV